MKQPQPEANAKSGSDEPATTDSKAGVMKANPPQGQTGRKGVAHGAVGGDPVTEEALTKQVAQLHQLLEPFLPESRPQGQPKPDPCSKVFSGTSDKEASNKGNLEEQGGFATWPSPSFVLDLALDPASAHAPDDSTSSARSSSAGSGDHVVAGSGVSHSQAPNRQGKPASKSDPSLETVSGETLKMLVLMMWCCPTAVYKSRPKTLV